MKSKGFFPCWHERFLICRTRNGNNKRAKRFSRVRQAEGEKKGRNQEKCENKAISWIKWDVTRGKTLMYSCVERKTRIVKGSKRNFRDQELKWMMFISRCRWKCVQIFQGKCLLSEQAIIGTWEIGESQSQETNTIKRWREVKGRLLDSSMNY